MSDGEFYTHCSLKSRREEDLPVAYSTVQIQSFAVRHIEQLPVIFVHDLRILDGYENELIGNPLPFGGGDGTLLQTGTPTTVLTQSSRSVVDRKSAETAEEIKVGKRVWFRLDKSEASWKCGVVKAVDESACTVLPMESKNQQDQYQRVPFELVRVMGDSVLSTLRFKKGDKVLTRLNGRWIPSIVLEVWPARNECSGADPLLRVQNFLGVQQQVMQLPCFSRHRR